MLQIIHKAKCTRMATIGYIRQILVEINTFSAFNIEFYGVLYSLVFKYFFIDLEKYVWFGEESLLYFNEDKEQYTEEIEDVTMSHKQYTDVMIADQNIAEPLSEMDNDDDDSINEILDEIFSEIKIFVSPLALLTFEEVDKLQINDEVDWQRPDGLWIKTSIGAKKERSPEFLLRPFISDYRHGISQWINYKNNPGKFAPAKSISEQPATRMKSLVLTDFVLFRPISMMRGKDKYTQKWIRGIVSRISFKKQKPSTY